MSKHGLEGSGVPAAKLTIAEVAGETGVAAATLRAWEERHGFPVPQRLRGGQRRYAPADVVRLRRVLAERAAGATLRAAITRALEHEAEATGSFFADLRWGTRQLDPQVVTKRTMIALSHAIEDECSARAERGLLVGAFQERRFYAPARRRWRDLQRGAQRALVFADFPEARLPAGAPAEVPIPRRDPLDREWALVYLAVRSSVLLLGRELPGQSREQDGDRRFELVWSADPSLVWDALETAVRLARRTALSAAFTLRSDLAQFPHPLGLEPGFVTALTNRMIGYLDR